MMSDNVFLPEKYDRKRFILALFDLGIDVSIEQAALIANAVEDARIPGVSINI